MKIIIDCDTGHIAFDTRPQTDFEEVVTVRDALNSLKQYEKELHKVHGVPKSEPSIKNRKILKRGYFERKLPIEPKA